MNIVVLAGGISDEREVSLSSGSKIANALLKYNHNVILLDSFIGSDKYNNFHDFYKNHGKQFYEHKISSTSPNIKELKNKINSSVHIGPNVISICKSSDLVFVALHGGIGENGKLQAIFDCYNIKYTGTGYKGSLLSMDKGLSKDLMTINKIETPKYSIITSLDDEAIIDYTFPLVIKPNDNGSSIGVHIAKNEFELKKYLRKAFLYSDTVIIEEYIKGREFSVGILGDTILPVIELFPEDGFYDYYHKYQQGQTLEIVPADIDDNDRCNMQQIALRLHNIMGLEVYSRSDFIMDKNNKIFCIEINTLPGMTPTSLLPQEAKSIGISYEMLCNKIVQLSLDRYY